MRTIARNILLAIAVVLLVPVGGSVARADDATVIPKGVFDFGIEGKYWFPIDRRYDPNGKVEDVATDFNATLDSTVFPVLAPLNPFVPGLANIGDTIVDFEYQFTDLEFTFLYGLTDHLTVGLKLPYSWEKTKVKEARLDTTNANVGKNAAAACGSLVCPLAVPGTVPFTSQDVQNLLGPGLDINGDGTVDVTGFGLDPVATTSRNGIGDLETGFRYQYAKTKDWRLAFTGGVRFPTGAVNDPDNLIDFGLGAGAYALLFQLNTDVTISNLWNSPRESRVEGGEGRRFTPEQLKAAEEQQAQAFRYWGDLVLNFTFKYDLYLSDKETLRVPSDVNQPLTANKENVDRNIGNIFRFLLSGTYTTVIKGLSFSVLYEHGFKERDNINGNQGFAYESLEAESNWRSDIIKVGMSYTTIPLYLEKKFPFPIKGSLVYRNRFKGANNALKSQYMSLLLEAFF